MYQYNDYELLYLISEHDENALDIMYHKYMPLIKARIAAFRIKRYNQEDFFQEGLLCSFGRFKLIGLILGKPLINILI